jgi:hypothetical protein
VCFLENGGFFILFLLGDEEGFGAVGDGVLMICPSRNL